VTKPARDPFDGFACRLGDVIVRAGGEEAWLAGALVLAEDAPVAAIFIAPEARRDRVVYARVRDAALVWLTPVSEEVIITGTEPPSVIEIDTARFERQRRLPLRVERVGSGTPDVGERVILAEYTASGGERLILLVGAVRRAWRGSVLEQGDVRSLPGRRDGRQRRRGRSIREKIPVRIPAMLADIVRATNGRRDIVPIPTSRNHPSPGASLWKSGVSQRVASW